jgi:hypothetical protein
MYLKSQTNEKAPRFRDSLFMTKYKPNKNSTKPCPISPNMTPKKKGKVTVVKIAGLIYS